MINSSNKQRNKQMIIDNMSPLGVSLVITKLIKKGDFNPFENTLHKELNLRDKATPVEVKKYWVREIREYYAQ